jgi:dynein heavy chain
MYTHTYIHIHTYIRIYILSQAKEPRAVQPHLRKCFDNLVKLDFGAEEGRNDMWIYKYMCI